MLPVLFSFLVDLSNISLSVRDRMCSIRTFSTSHLPKNQRKTTKECGESNHSNQPHVVGNNSSGCVHLPGPIIQGWMYTQHVTTFKCQFGRTRRCFHFTRRSGSGGGRRRGRQSSGGGGNIAQSRHHFVFVKQCTGE